MFKCLDPVIFSKRSIKEMSINVSGLKSIIRDK